MEAIYRLRIYTFLAHAPAGYLSSDSETGHMFCVVLLLLLSFLSGSHVVYKCQGKLIRMFIERLYICDRMP